MHIYKQICSTQVLIKDTYPKNIYISYLTSGTPRTMGFNHLFQLLCDGPRWLA